MERGRNTGKEQWIRPLAAARDRGFWPCASHRALLLAATSRPPELQSALRRWQREADLQRVDHASLTILPLLYRNLCRHDCEADFREHLRGIYRWSWHKNQLFLAAVGLALACLRQAGIEVVLMKGVPLALYAYRDLGARMMGDADLIVTPNEAPRAVAALSKCGWIPERTLEQARSGGLTGVNLRDERGRCIDLHWHVLPESYNPQRDEELLALAMPIEVAGEPTRCLSPADHLLEIVCHGLSWAANAPIHWITDAVTLLAAESHLDWDRLIEQAGKNHRTRYVVEALDYLVRTFDVAVPDDVLQRLKRLPQSPEERLGFWFAVRSDSRWPWGRLPLVAATYVRARRAEGRLPQPVDFLRFLGARAACTPREWLVRAGRAGLQHRKGRATTIQPRPHRG